MQFPKRAIFLAVPFFVITQTGWGMCAREVTKNLPEDDEPQILYRIAGEIRWAAPPRRLIDPFSPGGQVSQINERLRLGPSDYTYFRPFQWGQFKNLIRNGIPIPENDESYSVSAKDPSELQRDQYVRIPTWVVEKMLGGNASEAALQRINDIGKTFEASGIPYAEEIKEWLQIEKLALKDRAARAARWHFSRGGSIKFGTVNVTEGGVLDDFTFTSTQLHHAGEIVVGARFEPRRNLISINAVTGSAADDQNTWRKHVEQDLVANASKAAFAQAGPRSVIFLEKTREWYGGPPQKVKAAFPQNVVRSDLKSALADYFLKKIIFAHAPYLKTQQVFMDFRDVHEFLFDRPVSPELESTFRELVSKLKEAKFESEAAIEKSFYDVLGEHLDAEIDRLSVAQILHLRVLVDLSEQTQSLTNYILGLQSAGQEFDPDVYPQHLPEVRTAALALLAKRDECFIYPQIYDQFREAIDSESE